MALFYYIKINGKINGKITVQITVEMNAMINVCGFLKSTEFVSVNFSIDFSRGLKSYGKSVQINGTIDVQTNGKITVIMGFLNRWNHVR